MKYKDKVNAEVMGQIAELNASGMSDRQIAKNLGLCKATIRLHRSRMQLKSPFVSSKVTDEKQKTILEMTQAGRSSKEIASVIGISKTAVAYHLKKLGVKSNLSGGTFSKLTATAIGPLSARHALGETLSSLAAETGCCVAALWNAFRRNGHWVRSSIEARSYPIDSNCFQALTDDSAYWLGFAITDGSNESHGKGRGLSVSLAIKDMRHLEKLKAFARYEGPIYRSIQKGGFGVGREYCRLRIGNPKVSADLTKWGVTPNKTFTATAHPDLAYNRHFWRGAIDGDGWVGKNTKCPTVGLCGSKNLVSQFADYVLSLTGSTLKVRPDRNIYVATCSGPTARKVLAELYTNCSTYLDRKMARATEHLGKVLNKGKVPKTVDVIEKIIYLRKAGLSSNKIGKRLGISKATAMRYIKLRDTAKA